MPPEVVFLDLPQLRDAQVPHHPLIAARADPWPGELAVWRSPEASGFSLLTSFTGRASLGRLVADLYSGPGSRFDHGNSVYVEIAGTPLQSVSDLQLFAGENALAIAQPGGGWEVLQFGEATLLAPGKYRLSRLLRGQRGTEGDMAPVVAEGARVVLLDETLAPLPVEMADLGLPAHWRVGPAIRPVTDDSYAEQVLAPEGVGLRPFAPVHVAQPWRQGRVPGDFTIRWTRRDRSLTADSWGPGEVPMSEGLEVWLVEIMDGAAVKRSLTTAAPSALYSTADQSADWGAPLGSGDHLEIRIAQIGQATGAGRAAITTLWF